MASYREWDNTKVAISWWGYLCELEIDSKTNNGSTL